MFEIVKTEKGNWVMNKSGEILVRDIADQSESWISQNIIEFDSQDKPQFKYVTVTDEVQLITDNQKLLAPRLTPSDDSNLLDQDQSTGKKNWEHPATLALIAAVESRYEDLFHVGKRKYFWRRVSEELSSQSFEFSDKTCAKKWENLIRTYKTIKDIKMKTGRGPKRFHYFDRLAKVFGDSPASSSSITIDINMLKPGRKPITKLNLEPKAIPSKTKPATTRIGKNLSLEFVKMKKAYYERKEDARSRHGDMLQAYFDKCIKLKEDKQKYLDEKLKLEKRKVEALEVLAGIARKTEEN